MNPTQESTIYLELGARAYSALPYENDGPPSASIAYIKELAR